MNKKAVITITITLGVDLNEEHVYQAVTRLEGEVHNHINMGMLASVHPQDANVTDVNVGSDFKEV